MNTAFRAAAGLACTVVIMLVAATALTLEPIAALAAPPAYLLKSVTKPSTSGVPDRLVDFEWSADNGKTTTKLSALAKGKPVFLNFWATWCGPCRAELPDIVAMNAELKGKVVFVGVSLDQERSDEKTLKLVQNFMDKNKMTYPNIIGITGTQDLARPYGNIESIPTTLIIDKNGKIVERVIGSRSKAEFMELLKKVM
jgi:thiol-disulfide isomerase/thioredoxin